MPSNHTPEACRMLSRGKYLSYGVDNTWMCHGKFCHTFKLLPRKLDSLCIREWEKLWNVGIYGRIENSLAVPKRFQKAKGYFYLFLTLLILGMEALLNGEGAQTYLS